MFERIAQSGADVHRRFSILGFRDADGKWLGQMRLEHRDREQMRQALRRIPPGTPMVVEASFGWGWICDEMKGCELDPHLCSTYRVANWRKARGKAKSNRIDAELLSELPGQQEWWWEVWLPPPEVRQEREWLRYRATLVQMQTQIKCRIHAVLHRHGIWHDFSDLFGGAGIKFLEDLIGSADRLPESGRATLQGYLGHLIYVRQQIAEVTKNLRQRLGSHPVVRRLMTIPGIGWILAHTILAEIGVIERFASNRHLASYSLLAPRAYDSGDDDPQNPIGRHVGFIGRRTLKWAFIEAAHAAVVKSSRFAGIFSRRTNGGKKDRNRGYIAVGHELCCTVYLIWKRGIAYQENPPPRPGSIARPRRRRDSSSRSARPAVSQPDAPMVPVVAGTT